MSLLNDNIAQAQEIDRLTKKCKYLEDQLRKSKKKSSVDIDDSLAFLDEKIAQMEKFCDDYAKHWLDIPYYRNAKKELAHLKAIRKYILESLK